MVTRATELTFWGVRGSTPTLDRTTMRYGGNTPCLELTTAGGTRFILDCGTGLRMLGNHSLAANGNPMDAHVFVTHYHWDHIQGLPFFKPMFSPRNKFHFYSMRSDCLGSDSLKRVLEAQMALPYSPVDLSSMSAERCFTEMAGGDSVSVADASISACWLNHPQGCLGFRFDTPEGSVVYATDNEPGRPEFDRKLVEFCAGADVLINDAQFTPAQLAGNRKGWGHSSWESGVQLAKAAGVKHLVLFHHDPDSTDKTVDDILRQARSQFENVSAAAEGMVVTMRKNQLELTLPVAPDLPRQEAHFAACVFGQAANGSTFQEETVLRTLSIQGANLEMNYTPKLQSRLQVTIRGLHGSNGNGDLVRRGQVVRLKPAVAPNKVSVDIVFSE